MSKEYIEREVLIEIFKRIKNDKTDNFSLFADSLIDFIKTVPFNADVQEVRHGEWLEDDYGYCHCSNCRYEHDSPECITPYCPECGAKMDKE